MATIENLSIQISTSADAAVKEIDSIATALNRLNHGSKGQISGLDKLAQSMTNIGSAARGISANVGQKLENLARGLKALQEVGKIGMSSTLGKNIESINNALSKLNTNNLPKVERIAKEMGNIGAAAELLKDVDFSGLTNLADALKRFEGLENIKIKLPEISGTASGDTNIPEIGNLTDAIDAGMEDVAEGAQTGEAAIDSFKDKLKGLAGEGSAVAKVLGGIGGSLKSIGKGVVAIPMYFGKQFIGNIQEAGQKVGFFFNQIKRVAMYRLIRTALKMITQGFQEGLKNLYAWSSAAGTQFANSMNTISTASHYAGNSIAAMASPIINALAPAIDFIADKLVDLFNLFNQVFARLSGQTSYTAAKKVASQWQDASDKASGSAKKAADEIKRTILGFDEINKLNDNNTSSGGGGGVFGSGSAGASMFETRQIEGDVSNFVDQLKKKFEESNWKGLGELLGGKVNEIVDSIDFAGAGQKVGYYINAWFSTKYWTLETINFTNIGSKIAEFLNNAIKEIDFEILGRLAVQKFTIVASSIIGFVETFDWGQTAEKFSKFVEGIYNQLSKFLQETDWKKLGDSIVNGIVGFFTKADYAGLAKSASEFLGSALGAAVGLIVGLGKAIGEKIGEAFNGIGEFFNEQIEACGGDIVGGILRGIIVGLIDIGVWIVDNIFKPFIDGFKKAFGIHSPASTMIEPGKEIMNGVLKGILNVMGTIAQWITDNVFDGIKKAFELSEVVVLSLAAIGETIINTVLGGILNVMGGIVKWVADNIIGPLLDAFTKDDEEKEGEDFSSKLWKAIKGKWDDSNRQLVVKLKADKDADDIWRSFSGDWDNGEKTVAIIPRFSRTAKMLFDDFEEAWVSLGSRTMYLYLEFNNTARTLYDNFRTAWDEAGSAILYFSPKMDNTAKVLYDAFVAAWDTSGSKSLYFSPKLDNDASVLYKGFKADWDKTGSKILYFSPKMDNTAKTLYDNFKSDWDAAESKTLYMSPKLDNEASVLWNAFKDAWNNLVRTLYASPKLDNEASVLWNQFKTAWNNLTRIVYASPKLDNEAQTLWNAFKADWNALNTRSLYASPKLDNTAAALWSQFKAAWDVAKSTLTIPVEIDYGDSFGDATGGGGSTSGGGAGRGRYTVSVALDGPSNAEVNSLWERFKKAWEATVIAGKKAVNVVFADPTNQNATSLWDRLKEAWSASVTACDKGLDVIVRPVTNKAGTLLSSAFSKIGTWLWGTADPPQTNVKINAAYGKGFTVNYNGGATLSGIGDSTVKVNGTPGAGFVGQLSGTNTYTLAGIESQSVKVNASPGSGFSGNLSNNSFSLGGINPAKATINAAISGDKTVITALSGGSVNKNVNVNVTTNNSSGNDTLLIGDTSPSGLTSLLKQVNALKENVTKKIKISFQKGAEPDTTTKKALAWKSGDSKGIKFNVKDGSTNKTAKNAVNAPTSDIKGISVDMGVKKGSNSAVINFFSSLYDTISKTVTIAMTVAKNASNAFVDWLGTIFKKKALGGVFSNGLWSNIPQYAGGTTNAHGSLFLAGEAGPEVVGHVGGRTEVLNKSQLAATMYSAVRNAMSGVTLDANFYDGSNGEEYDYEMMYKAMYDAFSAVMARTEERDREKVALLRQINEKDFSPEITANSIARGMGRMNRRAGTTVVPTGT